MKYFIALLALSICLSAYSQEWHSAKKKLKQPRKSGYNITVIFYDKYDTVPCVYVTNDGKQEQKGYKYIYLRGGFYTDNASTVQVFFDERMKRVYNVKRYYFE